MCDLLRDFRKIFQTSPSIPLLRGGVRLFGHSGGTWVLLRGISASHPGRTLLVLSPPSDLVSESGGCSVVAHYGGRGSRGLC